MSEVHQPVRREVLKAERRKRHVRPLASHVRLRRRRIRAPAPRSPMRVRVR